MGLGGAVGRVTSLVRVSRLCGGRQRRCNFLTFLLSQKLTSEYLFYQVNFL